MSNNFTRYRNIDLQETEKFVRHISKDGQLCYQTFSDVDKSDRSASKVIECSSWEIPQRLTALNKKGAAICLAINGTNGRGRKKDAVTEIRAAFVDFDKPDRERPERLLMNQIVPSMIVESSKGRQHAYFSITDVPVSEFASLQRDLAGLLDGDKQITDASRVMRVPGFLNHKRGGFPVRIIHQSNHTHSYEEVKNWISLAKAVDKQDLKGVTVEKKEPYNHQLQERIAQALNDVIYAEIGTRNSTLNRQAYHLYRLLLSNNSCPEEITEKLSMAGRTAGLLQADIDRTLRGAKDAAELIGENPDDGYPRKVDLADLSKSRKPTFQTEKILPRFTTTLLSGHGGVGKSTLANQLAICTALGTPLFGLFPTKKGRVIYYSGEDDGDIIRSRLNEAITALGVKESLIQDRISILDATINGTVLYSATPSSKPGSRKSHTTKAYEFLLEEAISFNADLIILDNTSALYNADENDRSKVTPFVHKLSALAKVTRSAVLLLGHIDKETARGNTRGNETYSGNSGWHNAVRSRLFMRQNNGVIYLEHKKSTYGPLAETVSLEWKGGIFTPYQEPVASESSKTESIKKLLTLIAEANDREEHISTSKSANNNAQQTLALEHLPPEYRKGPAIFSALRQAEQLGYVEKAPNPTRKASKIWSVTLAGHAYIRD